MIMQASNCPLYETIVAEGRQATAEEIREWLDTLFTNKGIGTWLTNPNNFGPSKPENVGIPKISFVERVSHPSNHEKHGESNAPSGLWAHLGMMRIALERDPEYDNLTPRELQIEELCIMWHDLCKKETAAPAKNKAWDDGTPQDTNFQHGPLAAKLFMMTSFVVGGADNCMSWFDDADGSMETWDPRQTTGIGSTGAGVTHEQWLDMEKYDIPAMEYIIRVHMEAHPMMEFAITGIETGEWPKNRDFRILPEELQPLVGDAEAWDWPEHADFPIELQNVWDKQTYNRCRLWNCRLLRIFQRCDTAGRFDDQRITP
jgi:hypothetical protein